MASAGLTDDSETAEKVNEELLQKMSNDETGPELSVNELSPAPQEVKNESTADKEPKNS